MSFPFVSRSGIAVARSRSELDYAEGAAFLVDALDRRRGGYFSSGVEDPDRYSRWDFGFVDPPVELIGRQRQLTVRALSPRGVPLIAMLRPILAADPAVSLRQAGEREYTLAVAPGADSFPEEERSRQPSLFTPLRHLIADFAGLGDGFLGLYGAFAYDLIFQFEPMPLAQARAANAKLLHLYLPDRLYLVDRRKEAAYRHDFEFAADDLTTKGLPAEPFAALPPPQAARNAPRTIVSSPSAERYMAMVDEARERMRVGDIFEVVLSRTFSAGFDRPPSELYRLMRRNNPSPYEFLCQFGDEQLIGASPEMFVRVEGERVESCPISGTARRGGNAMEEAERLLALYNSEKDEVELTMCTDVDRNDKARICLPGSVRLLARRMVERYAGLFHTVDHVEGRLRPGFTGLDAFFSHMWAVTLTGAPKRMAVSIVEAMEAGPRGWYGGAVGGLSLNGDVNTGITIRTAHLTDGTAHYRVGATLVWDSLPAEEEAETRIKSTVFFRALESLDRPAVLPTAKAPARPFAGLEIVMVDNEDSFVHTLADYLRQTGANVTTYRWGLPAGRLLAAGARVVVHSPGPGRPADFGVPALVRALAERGVAQFGVCLGLQGTVEAFGGSLAVLAEPRHGKFWQVRHEGDPLFAGIPSPARFGAYHSLVAVKRDFPASLRPIAWNEGDEVMALRHRERPILAVQFHPESILSMHGELGHRLVQNALASLAATIG
ncbi:MAG: anthranilate synthase component I [Alphaproteobacteria bacterium]|nr:anthranilate synthase component I [Alphaproteobacteria bacterium]